MPSATPVETNPATPALTLDTFLGIRER